MNLFDSVPGQETYFLAFFRTGIKKFLSVRGWGRYNIFFTVSQYREHIFDSVPVQGAYFLQCARKENIFLQCARKGNKFLQCASARVNIFDGVPEQGTYF